MALEFSHDSDLMFLSNLTDEQLEPLVKVLIEGKNGAKRWTEQLSMEARYIRCEPAHSKYWDLIAAEFEDFGSRTWGKKRSYRDILCGVCDKKKVNYNRNSRIEVIERNLFQKVLCDSIERLSREELKEVAEELGLNRQDANVDETTNFTAEGVAAAMQVAIRTGGFPPYKVAVILLHSITSAVGLTLPFVAYTTLTRTMAIFAGPIGVTLTALWATMKLLGPAYRVIVRATVIIACLRQIHKHEKDAGSQSGP